MVGYRHCLMSPACRPVDKCNRIGNSVHSGHIAVAVELNTLFGIVVHFRYALYLDKRICGYNDISRIGIVVQLARYKECSSALYGAQLHLLNFLVLGKYLYFQRAAVVGDIIGDNGLFVADFLKLRSKNVAHNDNLFAEVLYSLAYRYGLFADSSSLYYLGRFGVEVLIKSRYVKCSSGDNGLHFLGLYLVGSLIRDKLTAVVRHIRFKALYHLVVLLNAYGGITVKDYLDSYAELIVDHSGKACAEVELVQYITSAMNYPYAELTVAERNVSVVEKAVHYRDIAL